MTGQHISRAEQLEQAIAFGRSVQWMVTKLGATRDEIAAAHARLADAVADDAWYQRQQTMGAR